MTSVMAVSSSTITISGSRGHSDVKYMGGSSLVLPTVGNRGGERASPGAAAGALVCVVWMDSARPPVNRT